MFTRSCLSTFSFNTDLEKDIFQRTGGDVQGQPRFKLHEYVWFSVHDFIMFIVYRLRLYLIFCIFSYFKFAYNKNIIALNFVASINLGNCSIKKCACIKAAENVDLTKPFYT